MTSLLLLIGQALVSSSALLLLRSSLPKILELKFAAGWQMLGQFGLGGFLYIASFLLWLYILSKTQVTYAYPVSVAITLLFTTLGATLLLGEKFTWLTFVGIVLIIGGIAVVSIKQG